MKSLFVDTNYFCSLYNKQDSLHNKAKTISLALAEFSLITSNFVLLETYTILSQRVSKTEAIWFKENIVLTDITNIYWIDKTFEADVWNIFASIKDKNFSYVDASILAVMQKEKITHLLSFDDAFTNLQKLYNFELLGV